MRHYSLLAALFLFSLITTAQTPDAIHYQAVARDNTGTELASAAVNVRFTIHQTTPGGTTVYQETHATTTNAYGLFYLDIGAGTVGTGTTLGAIAWGSDLYYLEVELDAGAGYENMGTTQFVTVPYAFHATTADNAINDAVDDADNDPTNELELPTTAATSDVLTWNGTGWVAQPSGGADNWGTQVAITDGTTIIGDGTAGSPITGNYQAGTGIGIASGTITNTGDADADPTNEYNSALTIAGNTIQVTDAGGPQSFNLTPVAPAGGEVLTWNGGTSQWEAQAPAGGDNDWIESGVGEVYNLTDNIGIGTATPGAQLEIESTGLAGIIVDAGAGNDANLDFYEGGSIQSNVWWSSVGNYLGISGWGNDVVIVPAGGNVGIGMQNPTEELTVQAGAAGTTVQVLNVAGNEVHDLKVNGADHGVYQMKDAAGTQTVQLFSAGDSYLTGGNVGIGTVAPLDMLSVAGGSIVLRDANDVEDAVELAAGAGPGASGSIAINSSGSPTISLSGAASMSYFNTGGTLGVGTNSPDATLDVVGTMQYQDGSEAAGYVLTSDATGNASWQAGGTSGSGATNYVPKWISPTGLGDSQIQDDGVTIGVGIAPVATRGVSFATEEATGIQLDFNRTAGGTKVGIQNNMNTVGAGLGGQVVGLKNDIFADGSSTAYGIQNVIASTASDKSYGTYNQIQSTSGAEQYGTYNFINNGVDAEKFGVYTDIDAGGLTSNVYGEYIDVTGATTTGYRYGIYVDGGQIEKNWFSGDVGIGIAATVPSAHLDIDDGLPGGTNIHSRGGNIEIIDGHVITGGVFGPTFTGIAVEGNDISGKVTMNIGSETFLFENPYTNPPMVVITPIDGVAAGSQYYVSNVTPAGFEIFAPFGGGVAEFYYMVIAY